jgi:hypothetical protein
MAREIAAARQFSFRLPQSLVERVEACAENLRDAGLEVNRAAVVRLLLTHALDATGCNLERLLEKPPLKRHPRRK